MLQPPISSNEIHPRLIQPSIPPHQFFTSLHSTLYITYKFPSHNTNIFIPLIHLIHHTQIQSIHLTNLFIHPCSPTSPKHPTIPLRVVIHPSHKCIISIHPTSSHPIPSVPFKPSHPSIHPVYPSNPITYSTQSNHASNPFIHPVC